VSRTNGFSNEPSILGAIEGSAAVVVLDAEGRVRRWSVGATRLWGWPEAACLGRHWAELETIGDSVREAQARTLLADVRAGDTRVFEWMSRRANGTVVRLHSTIAPVHDECGAVVGAVCVSIDLSSREGFEKALVRAALHDQLTRLPGRSLFLHELGVALTDRRRANRPVVLFIDLDRFKRVNDEHGHAAGDEVLVVVAHRLRAAVRDGDVVARLGGDEFAILVDLGTSSDVAVDLAERVGRLLAAPIPVAGGWLEVGASIGVAVAAPDDEAEDVLARADAAMYRAKRGTPFEHPAPTR
jgi:diguanylate cyclase (GGDEF)-like protein/PAS domain S-box-containing protein